MIAHPHLKQKQLLSALILKLIIRNTPPVFQRSPSQLIITEFHDLPPGIIRRSAQMTRRVNPLDSYWCTVLNVFTVGATLKIHSARFCCREPPELKLISGDSDEIDWWCGGRYDGPSSKLTIHVIAAAQTSAAAYTAVLYLDHCGRTNRFCREVDIPSHVTLDTFLY